MSNIPSSNFPNGSGFGPMNTPPGSYPQQGGGYQSGAPYPAQGGALPMGAPDPLGSPRPTPSKNKGKGKSKKSTARGVASTPKPVTRRIVGTQRTIAIVAALLLALAVAASTSTKGSGIYEVRVNANIGALQTISQSQLIATPVGKYEVTGAFTANSPSAAIAKAIAYASGKTLSVQLFSNQELSQSDFSTNSGISLGGDQLVSLDATIAGAVGGTLAVNDTVDVVGVVNGTPTVVATGATVESITAGEGVYDSAASSQSSNRSATASQLLPTNPIPGIYILKTTPAQAKVIAAIQGSSTTSGLSLVYCQPSSC